MRSQRSVVGIGPNDAYAQHGRTHHGLDARDRMVIAWFNTRASARRR